MCRSGFVTLLKYCRHLSLKLLGFLFHTLFTLLLSLLLFSPLFMSFISVLCRRFRHPLSEFFVCVSQCVAHLHVSCVRGCLCDARTFLGAVKETFTVSFDICFLFWVIYFSLTFAATFHTVLPQSISYITSTIWIYLKSNIGSCVKPCPGSKN